MIYFHFDFNKCKSNDSDQILKCIFSNEMKRRVVSLKVSELFVFLNQFLQLFRICPHHVVYLKNINGLVRCKLDRKFRPYIKPNLRGIFFKNYVTLRNSYLVAIFNKDKCWHSTDVVLLCCLFIFININLQKHNITKFSF